MKKPPFVLTALLLRACRALRDCVTSLESRLKRQAVAMLAAAAFCISGSPLYAKDTPKPSSPEPPELSAELRVSLKEIKALPTRRQRIIYTFEVKEVIRQREAIGRWGNLVGFSLCSGSDVDDERRDALSRLGLFFGSFTTFTPDIAKNSQLEWLHTVRKTDTVNVKTAGLAVSG